MKFAIIGLLLTLSASAQQFTPDGKHLLLPVDRIVPIYTDLANYKLCIEDNATLRNDVIQLGTTIIDMAAENECNTAYRNELEATNRGLIDEAEKLQYDLGVIKGSKRKWYENKWLLIGLGAVGGAYIAHSLR